MDEITYKYHKDYHKIFINNKLHLAFKGYDSLHSYIEESKVNDFKMWYIELAINSTVLKLEYDSEVKWLSVLEIFNCL